jgi:hypothetical protein
MSQNLPPIFSDTDKFDGTNCVTWNGLISIATDLRGITGYLKGTIPKPSDNLTITITPPTTTTSTSTTTQQLMATDTTTTTPNIDTPWSSLLPSLAEWTTCNAWAKELLIYNTKDPIGLGIVMSGTAVDAWKSYNNQYAKVSEMALMNAKWDLRKCTYTDNHNLTKHVSRLRTLWATLAALGSQIDDKGFQTIVLQSLPWSWHPIVSTLYNTTTSRDAIAILNTHWAHISKDCVINPQNATTALKFNAGGRGWNQPRNHHLICANPNCRRMVHLISDCYWEGGGKAGQFPAWFKNKRSGVLSIKRGQRIGPENWPRWLRWAEGRRAWLQLVCCAPLGTVVPKLWVGCRDRRIEK